MPHFWTGIAVVREEAFGAPLEILEQVATAQSPVILDQFPAAPNAEIAGDLMLQGEVGSFWCGLQLHRDFGAGLIHGPAEAELLARLDMSEGLDCLGLGRPAQR